MLAQRSDETPRRDERRWVPFESPHLQTGRENPIPVFDHPVVMDPLRPCGSASPTPPLGPPPQKSTTTLYHTTGSMSTRSYPFPSLLVRGNVAAGRFGVARPLAFRENGRDGG